MSLTPFRSARLREWALWCLIFALPIQGVSGVLTLWLGSQHFHRQIVASGAPAHSHRHHEHATVQRHHHALTDTTVVALGADAAAGEEDLTPMPTAWGALLAMGGTAVFHLRSGLAHEWPDTTAWTFLSADAQLLDRPPDGARHGHAVA